MAAIVNTITTIFLMKVKAIERFGRLDIVCGLLTIPRRNTIKLRKVAGLSEAETKAGEWQQKPLLWNPESVLIQHLGPARAIAGIGEVVRSP